MLRKVRGAGRLVGERLSRATTFERPAKSSASVSIDDDDESRGRKVTFGFRVTIVLVPCREDLRPFSAQLWWGADDYLRFRHRYDLALESAHAAAASRNREGKEQRSRPPRGGPSAIAIFDAASLEFEAVEPAKKTRGANNDTPQSQPREKATSRPPRLSGRVPPLSSSQSCVNTTNQWTPSVGAMAAKTAADAEEEGYRTEAMSSASDSTLSGGDSSEADSADETYQQHRGAVFGREQRRRPAARRRPRRLMSV
eukprot:g10793.t1